MKKSLRVITAVFVLSGICLSLCSCSVFSTMRENALKASTAEIIPTPQDKEMFATFNTALKNTVTTANRINTSVDYGVSDVQIKSGEEKAGLLDKAGATIGKLIMANKPGHKSDEISPPSYAGTLLEKFDSASCLSFSATRNIAKEAVTDEKGKEVTDENGEVVRHEVTKDNYAKVTLKFYKDVVTQEAYTDENGEDVAEVTKRNLANNAIIDKVFGSPEDKKAVLEQFGSLKDYLEVKDYSLEYDACEVYGELDLATDTLLDTQFKKTMLVTANVKGVGALAEYGNLTVTFKLVKTDNFAFSYLEEE